MNRQSCFRITIQLVGSQQVWKEAILAEAHDPYLLQRDNSLVKVLKILSLDKCLQKDNKGDIIVRYFATHNNNDSH